MVVIQRPVKCLKQDSFPSHGDTNTPSKATHVAHFNHAASHMHRQENTRMCSCGHTMPIERLDTLLPPYGPSWPSVPLSACQERLIESALFLSVQPDINTTHSAASQRSASQDPQSRGGEGREGQTVSTTGKYVEVLLGKWNGFMGLCIR